jgi:hypothetical protein
MLYGYDAGVLGGVQTTEPFLRAMGVSSTRPLNQYSCANVYSILLAHMSSL